MPSMEALMRSVLGLLAIATRLVAANRSVKLIAFMLLNTVILRLIFLFNVQILRRIGFNML